MTPGFSSERIDMKLIRKIFHKMRHKYYVLNSRRSKKLFSEGKKKTYQFMDEVFCKDLVTHESIVKKHEKNTEQYWSTQSTFSIKDYFSQTYNKAKTLIFDDFLSLYDKKPILLDLGCANGEWTMMVAPLCEKIDGYEYSQKMVDVAIREAKARNVKNIDFFQADATTIKLNGIYDGALILGVLMYLNKTELILEVLRNIYDHLKPGAYLCTRDSLNEENVDTMFLYNVKNGYSGFYYSKEIYYSQFYQAGFIMKKEIILEEVNTRRLKFIHVGNIWQKPVD